MRTITRNGLFGVMAVGLLVGSVGIVAAATASKKPPTKSKSSTHGVACLGSQDSLVLAKHGVCRKRV